MRPGRTILFRILLVSLLLFSPYSSTWGENPEPALKFFILGDWGTGQTDQWRVAALLKLICRKHGCDFGVTVGDNFYERGVKGTDDPQWKEKFKDFYGPLGVPFYPVLGNHDWKGNAQAQVEYSKVDPQWRMAGINYAVTLPKGKGPLIDIFLMGDKKFTKESAQWLKKALTSSKAPWKFLVVHHPILNPGTQHSPDQKKIYPKIKDIVCGEIDFVLSGHEHIFSHLEDPSDACGWDQLIVGTGGKKLHGIKKKPKKEYKIFYSEKNYGVAYLVVRPQKLSLQFFQAEGTPSYQAKIPK